MMRRELVERRHWVSEERFLDLLGLANVIPGPSSTELAIYLGYERAGWMGLVVAGTTFILPAVLIVVFLAWLYTQLGGLPQSAWVFYGIKPVIIAIILQVLVGLARTAVKTPLLAVMGIVAFAVYLLTNNPILVIFGVGVVAMLLVNGARWWNQRKSRQGSSWTNPGAEGQGKLTLLGLGMRQAAGRVPRILVVATARWPRYADRHEQLPAAAARLGHSPHGHAGRSVHLRAPATIASPAASWGKPDAL